MNNIIKEVFKYHMVDFDKLLNYGFIQQNEVYCYQTLIVNGQMKLTIKINNTGNISTEVYDIDSDEIYTLFLVEEAQGVFVGEVRTDYQNALIDIRNNCFNKSIFKSEYALKIIDYIRNKYGDEPEYLWEKFPNNAVWRRQDNQKWYGAILTTKATSIGLNLEGEVEVIDFRESPELISNIIDKVNYFPAYHMNKKNWLTIKLSDCNMELNKIFEHIDNSYLLAKKK